MVTKHGCPIQQQNKRRTRQTTRQGAKNWIITRRGPPEVRQGRKDLKDHFVGLVTMTKTESGLEVGHQQFGLFGGLDGRDDLSVNCALVLFTILRQFVLLLFWLNKETVGIDTVFRVLGGLRSREVLLRLQLVWKFELEKRTKATTLEISIVLTTDK